MSIAHLYDDTAHLHVAQHSLQQARRYLHDHPHYSSVVGRAVTQLVAWIAWTEDEDEPA